MALVRGTSKVPSAVFWSTMAMNLSKGFDLAC